MSAINTYARGALVRIEATFAAADGAAVDPDTVTFRRRRPDGSVQSLSYGADGEVERIEAGAYAVQVAADQPGLHHYRWESTGTGQGALNRAFKVEDDVFEEA